MYNSAYVSSTHTSPLDRLYSLRQAKHWNQHQKTRKKPQTKTIMDSSKKQGSSSSTSIEKQPATTTIERNSSQASNDHKNRNNELKSSSTVDNSLTTPNSNNQSASRPLACGRRRRHTISNNHIEFMFYHCLRDDIDEEDEDEHDDDMDEEDSESSYHRISPTRRNDHQSANTLFDTQHCDVIVLKTDNGWCFDQEKPPLHPPSKTQSIIIIIFIPRFLPVLLHQIYLYVAFIRPGYLCGVQDIFLPAWRRDAYEAAGQEEGFTGQELVKVDEIRVD
ncbi:hypothetical protein PSTT_11217 [Puccinia striiformis]|uniref:Uncharacterized protein n=1 Tax=Puccinia striiformis TaxID=27350 RepID=A0A2S4V192_9BASI|nr:hypothetical protein PSTT_11217 [Puccinia striiformis]